jgi:hypothetical protein
LLQLAIGDLERAAPAGTDEYTPSCARRHRPREPPASTNHPGPPPRRPPPEPRRRGGPAARPRARDAPKTAQLTLLRSLGRARSRRAAA